MPPATGALAETAAVAKAGRSRPEWAERRAGRQRPVPAERAVAAGRSPRSGLAWWRWRKARSAPTPRAPGAELAPHMGELAADRAVASGASAVTRRAIWEA